MHILGTVKLSFGCHPQISDADMHAVMWPEGFDEDKAGEYWPDREYDAPALKYGVEIDVQSRHPMVNTGVARFKKSYGNEVVFLQVENYNQDDVWHVVG